MIQIKNKTECCGCNACSQKCPKNCIQMLEDNEGFLYPHVNIESCINCGLCEKVCPVIHQEKPVAPLNCFASQSPDNYIKNNSSSGGIFYHLAQHIINEHGIVYGVVFNKDWEAVHCRATNLNQVIPMMGSKYTQSFIGNTFVEIKEDLKRNKKVLFSGTPCQVAALKRFINKDSDNLITIDFICHGVPSPGIFRNYLNERLRDFKNPIESIKSISFRDKSNGWSLFNLRIEAEGETHKLGKRKVELILPITSDPYMRGFLNNLYLRPSCHHCPSKNFKSHSDITLGDFWGYREEYGLKNNDTGISACIINSNKGQKIFEGIECNSVSVSLESISRVNNALISSADNVYRHLFFTLYKRIKFDKIIELTTSQSLKYRIIRRLYRTVYQAKI